MAGGYALQPEDVFAELRQILQNARDRLREIEALDGTQIYNTVQDLRRLIEGVLTQTDVNVSGNVTAGGMGIFPGGINSLDVYSRLVTGSGSFRSTSTNILGEMGQTVSSRRFKQDIETAVIPRETLRKLRLVFFRYIANIPFDQEQQPLMLGLIAEEVHDLGITWLVIYDGDGRPEALVDFALPFLGLLLAQYDADDIDDLRRENAELRNRLTALDGLA